MYVGDIVQELQISISYSSKLKTYSIKVSDSESHRVGTTEGLRSRWGRLPISVAQC